MEKWHDKMERAVYDSVLEFMQKPQSGAGFPFCKRISLLASMTTTLLLIKPVNVGEQSVKVAFNLQPQTTVAALFWENSGQYVINLTREWWVFRQLYLCSRADCLCPISHQCSAPLQRILKFLCFLFLFFFFTYKEIQTLKNGLGNV